MAKNDITEREATEGALANMRLEGLEPSQFTIDCLHKLERGEITEDEYRQLGIERFSKLGKSDGR